MRKQLTTLPIHHSLSALFAAIGGSLVFIVLLFSFLTAPAARAQANVIYVDDDSVCTIACGGSWATAYPNLQDALAAATPGAEIWVAAGVYYPDEGAAQTDNDRTSAFQLQNGVALYGGFVGNETMRSERDWEANVTVLSGDIDGNDLTGPDNILVDTNGIIGQNAYHVVIGSGTDGSAVLDGFTITGGAAESEAEPLQAIGGGMVSDGGSSTLANLDFRGNLAVLGGGLYNCLSNPHLINVTFEGNEALSEGGGIQNDLSSPTLENITFYSNTAIYGGGMSNFGSACIESNSPSSLLDPLENERHELRLPARSANAESITTTTAPRLTQVTFISNTAAFGGGMYSLQSAPVLSDVTVTENYADEVGGGIYMEMVPGVPSSESGELPSKEAHSAFQAPSLTNVTISGNNVGGLGGGMFSLNISPTLSNVSFLGNFALGGGGLAALGGNPVIEDVTFGGNIGIIFGGALLTSGEAVPSFSGEALPNIETTEWEQLESFLPEATTSGSLQINRATFVYNIALLGGGVASMGGAPQISNAHFESNMASVGGAIADIDSGNLSRATTSSESSIAEANGNTVTSLTNVAFISNTAQSLEIYQEGIGGALFHIGNSNLETVASTFNGETTIDLLNVSFIGNSAGGAGAAMFQSATPALVNVAFSGNHAEAGGAMLSSLSNPLLTNVTFAGNFASNVGGAMLNADSHPLIQNSIFWANESVTATVGSIMNVGSVPTFTNTLVEGSGGSAGWNSSLGIDGGGNIDANPLFVRQPDPGDGDWSTYDDNDYGDLRLQEGSPAIDAGNNSADLDGDGLGTMTIADILEDLAGDPRIIFGTVDMGAFEFQSAELGLDKSVSTATALPGQTITYTLAFSNTGFALAHSVVISDPLPAELSNVNIQSTLPITPIAGIGYAWQLPDLAPGEGGQITISAVVSAELSADTVITNTAIISTPRPEQKFKDNISTVAVPVTVPRVSFGDSNFTVNEGAGTAVIDVILDAPNPYAAVQVSYSTAPGTATPGSDYTATGGVLTIPAGSGSASFNVPVFDDGQTEPAETVQLTLTSPSGAALFPPAEATLTILDGPALLYLPLIVHDKPTLRPDLVITGLAVTEGVLEVVVTNVGEGPVTTGFWVDAYINPDRPPERVNDVWWRVGDEGLVWGVSGDALPLEPGESLTLRYGDAYYVAEESGFSGTIEAGAQLYAQADSANTDDPFGGVIETHEATGGPYNNILGPVMAVTSFQAPAVESNGLLPADLPAR